MASNALECDICCNVFSEDNYPRILQCSHTFCGPCIDGIIATQKKTCPTCREEFTATSAEDLMINRSLLDVVKQLSSMNVKPKTLSRGPKESFLGFSKEFVEKLAKKPKADFREAETEILGGFELLREVKDVLAGIEILNEMRESVIVTKKEVEGSMEKLQEMKLSNENILDIIDQNIKWLMNRMSLIVQEEDADAKLETATNFTSSGPVMDETEEVLEEGQEEVKKSQVLLHEIERRRDDITKEILKMRIRLEKIAEELQKSFEVETLVISAVKVIGGKQMVAPVRVKPRNQVRLSHFAGDVPQKSFFLKHEALMTSPQRAKAFLDLAVGGTFLARLVLRVLDEGNLALNFLHVCAGDLGPSYANSQLSGVVNKGRDGERINVTGCKESVLKLDWTEEVEREIYKRTPHKAGEVRGYFSDELASAFNIVTRDHPNWEDNNCFGIVEEGLDALLKYPDITAVKIVDCGLMFSL